MLKRYPLVAVAVLMIPLITLLAACGDGDNDKVDRARTEVTGGLNKAQTGVTGGVDKAKTQVGGITGDDTPGAGGAEQATVDVTEKDFAISPGAPSAPAGNVKFNVRNDGPSTHEFIVIKTDLAPDQLPVKDGKVNEDANGIELVDEIEDIRSGDTKSLTTNLDTGRYVLICNIEGHYQQGMRVGFAVQ